MSDNGNVPQETQANPAGNLVEAATTTAAPSSTETTGSQQLSVPAESSSEPGTQLAQPKEEVKVEEKPSTEAQPKEHLVSVEEAARLRRRAQQAEEQARQKEQEAANLRGQLEERARQTQQQKPASGYDGTRPPTVNDFENYDDFMRESIKYDLRKENEKQKAEELKKQQQDKQKEVDRAFFARVATAQADKLPDYDDVIRSTPITLGNEVLQAIKESEVGPEVAYYLAKNPNDISRINQMSVASAVREIGKIEAKLTTVAPTPKQTAKVTQAPEPIKPIKEGNSAVSVDYDKMSIDDFMRRRIAETTVKVDTRTGSRVRLKR